MTEMPQHMRALGDANRVRLDIAGVKREVAEGTLTIREALEDPRSGSAPIIDLLRAQYRWGTVRARRVLAGLHVRDNRRVCELTLRQRDLIADAVEDPGVDVRGGLAA